ncbi:MAG TPA: hypothetical protein VIG90_00740 [Pedomonas sp.]
MQFPLQQQLQQLQQFPILQQLLLQQLQQQPFGQQFQPQGFFGDLLKQYGGSAGGAIGGLFGQPGLGQSIGNIAGQIGGLLPFQSAPQFPLMEAIQQGQHPILQQLLQAQQQLQQFPVLQQLFQQQILPQFPLLERMQQFQQQQQQPFGQQFAPQGFFGDLLKQYGGTAGGAIGGLFGQPGIGQTIGNIAGRLGGLLPFQSAPQFPLLAALQQQQQQPFGQQFQPQGFFGDLLKQYGGTAGGAIGGLFGQPGIGQSIGNIAGQLGNFLPFQSSPQFQPQGFFGDLLKQYGGAAGGAIGGLFGQPGIGQSIGNIAGRLGGLLPFQSAPQFPMLDQLQLAQQQLQQFPVLQHLFQQKALPQFQQQPFGQQFAPQGFFGDLLKQYGAPIGGAIGGAFGNQGLGQTIGGLAGQLGNFLPFQSAPQFQQPFGAVPPTSLPIQFAQQPGLC